jgi:hypothetical protein
MQPLPTVSHSNLMTRCEFMSMALQITPLDHVDGSLSLQYHRHDLAELSAIFPFWLDTDVTCAKCVIPYWEKWNRTAIKPKRVNLQRI